MKNKKIAAILAITLTGSYILPTNAIATTVTNKVVLAQHKQVEASAIKDTDNNTNKNDAKNNISKNEGSQNLQVEQNLNGSNINFYNIWGGVSVEVAFNTSTMKIEATRKSGDLGDGNNNYVKLSYYNSQSKSLTTNQVVDGNSENLASLLNNKSFNYGDIIGIQFEEGSNYPELENGQVISQNGQMQYFEITKNGLEAYSPQVSVNAMPIITGGKVTTASVSGKGAPNKTVSAIVNGQTFTGKTDANGDFNINLTDANGFSENTKVTLEIPSKVGSVEKEVSPTLAKGISINKNQIVINNVWNDNIGTITFNPFTQKIEFEGGWSSTNPYLPSSSEAFGISLYNKNGVLIKSTKIYGDKYPQSQISNFLNNNSYEYGEYIKIDYITSSNIDIKNFDGQANYNVKKPIILEITKGGLVQSNIQKVSVNPLAILDGTNNIKNGVITGKVNPNENVSVTVNGKTFDGMANSNGEFSINIEDQSGFTQATEVVVNADGFLTNTITPVINNSIKIQNSSITFVDNYGSDIGIIKFDPANETITFDNTGAEVNPYVYPETEAFKVSLYNKLGQIQGSVTAYGDSYPQNALSQLLNNKHFEYGSYIKVTYADSTGIYIANFNGQKSYKVTGTTVAKITKDGLVSSTIPTIQVNPFGVLGSGVAKSGVVTGSAPANNEVAVSVDGKTFTGKANNDGKFAINVSDANGFNPNTVLKVWTQNELGVEINPVVPANWGINGTKIQLPNNSLGIAQTISFNPNTMTITNLGNSFAAQLIDGTTGNVTASIANGNFNVFTSKNNLNGASFKYGDIINIYESKETYLSDGAINMYTGGKETSISPINKFESFEITKNGLVQVSNKDLSNPVAQYEGNDQVTVSGKTTPNTNVQIYYANDKKTVVKSNSEGSFSLNLPVSEAVLGSEVRIYVNNENNKSLVVGYDPQKFNANNSIQLLNNEKFPVINLTFSPLTNKIVSMVYPIDDTYAGVFYGNKMNVSLLNGKTGSVIKSVTSQKPGEIESFAKQLSGVSYVPGEIIKINYDNAVSGVNVFDDNKEIGNSTGTTEYFEITNKGLININNKFISVDPLNILGNGNITKTTLTGQVKANEKVTAMVSGKEFTTVANSNGKFNLNITDENGFNSNTDITLSADGYMPTVVKPEIEKNININDSYINFYQNGVSWKASSLCSSIGFNLNNNTFFVNNYDNSFGTGNENYFTIDLYDGYGNQILGQSFTGESTTSLSKFLNGKKFSYGDIIGLNYDSSKYKPVAVNGNNVLGNVTGNKEYFEITKTGLKQITFGNKSTSNSVVWSDGNLSVKTQLSLGNSLDTINAEKQIVLLNSSNQIIARENAITSLDDTRALVTGTLTSKDLDKIQDNQSYTIAIDINGTIMPIYVNGNIKGSSEYDLNGSNIQSLTISKNIKYVNIENSNDISSYLTETQKSIANVSENSLMNNSFNENKVLATTFINRIGVKNLESFYNGSTENANFLNWVLNNSTAMKEFLSGPNPDGAHVPEDQSGASYAKCLQVWSNIWNTYSNSHSGFNLKLAIAVSLTNGGFIRDFPGTQSVGNPVQRYNIFENLNANGGMMKGFDELDVSHLCYVTNAVVGNDQIQEMRNIILQNHNGLLTPDLINNIAYTMNYNTKNPHTGVSAFSPNFFGPNPTVKDVWYDGGVCGTVGWLGATSEQVFGVPAVMTPQPGHNAFIYYNTITKKWQVGNNISGWGESADADMSSWSDILSPNDNFISSYTELYQAADNGTLQNSNMYLYLAQSQTNYQDKLNSVKEAIKVDNLNMGAWIELVNLYHSNPNLTLNDYDKLANSISSTFANYSIPTTNLIHYLYSTILEDAISQASLNLSNASKLSSQIQNANKILQNVNTSQTDILAAIKALDYKQINMQTEIDKLKTDIANAKKNLSSNIYTSQSTSQLSNAINSAEKVVNMSNPTAVDITNSIKNITSANSSLEMIPVTVGLVLADQTQINGTAAPNATVILNIANKNYSVKANENGQFEFTNLPQLNANEKFSIYSQENNSKTAIETKEVQGLGLYKLILNDVWNYNMGTLTFNPVKKELNVVKGWDASNPYLPSSSEAFSISLLNSNKTLIKTVTIHGSEEAGEAVYDALNGIGFEYGDYLNVNFKTSSNLSLNYVLVNGKVENSYKITGNKLFKITQNGLELVGNDSPTKNSNKKNNDKNSTQPKINTSQLENQLKLDIASANKLMSNSGYTLASRNDLGMAINSGENVLGNSNATQKEVQGAITQLLNAYKGLVVNKSQLNYEIKAATALVNSNNYTKQSAANLENAIKAAQEVNNNKDATALGVENAIAQLNAAAKELVANKVDNQSLRNINETNYWIDSSNGKALVINGNVMNGNVLKSNISKKLVIQNSQGQVIGSLQTTPVNWYSKNKENYSGYQAIISNENLSKLKVGETYKIGIDVNGKFVPLQTNGTLSSYGQYKLENKDGNVCIVKSNIIQEGIANYKIGYSYNNGFIINANVALNNDVISASQEKEIVITNDAGKVVYTSNTIPVNWYSKNKENYSGLQAYIPVSELNNLNNSNGEYKISILVKDGSNEYSMPIEGGNININSNGYKIYSNNGSLSLVKQQNVSGKATKEDQYTDGNNTVINAKFDIPEVLAGSTAKMEITQSNGEVVSTQGILVNWYSGSKNNYNGAQFVINSKDLNTAKNIKITVSAGNKNYNLQF